MRPVLISGIQPSGQLHIGNYLGALKNFVELQNSGKYECYFFIADFHSLTEEFDPKEKQKQILNLAKFYLAAGLAPEKSTIFVQSVVPQVTELFWILNILAPFGETSRMTQFKEKGAGKDSVNVGLFTYPLLMAADILLYNAEFVPVGEDQVQHLELARTLVRKFNSQFGETFKEPKSLLAKTPRIMSLQDPTKKMSKSDPKGCLFLNDSEVEIKEKIKTAVTDSGREIKYDIENKPAISNLLEIYSSFSNKDLSEIEKEFQNKTYSKLKEVLSELLSDSLKTIRNNYQKLEEDKVWEILDNGALKASQIASKKINQIKEKMGLIRA